MQRTASSSSLASSNGNPTELRRESSLIDFDADPEPPSIAPVPQTQQIPPSAPVPVPAPAPAPAQFMSQPTVSSNDNWASFDSSPVIKPSQPPSSVNLLDMLSELSVPPSGNTSVVSTPPSTFTPGGGPVGLGPSFNAFGNSGDGGQWQNVHGQQNLLPATGIQPPTSSFNQAGGGSLQNQVQP